MGGEHQMESVMKPILLACLGLLLALPANAARGDDEVPSRYTYSYLTAWSPIIFQRIRLPSELEDGQRCFTDDQCLGGYCFDHPTGERLCTGLGIEDCSDLGPEWAPITVQRDDNVATICVKQTPQNSPSCAAAGCGLDAWCTSNNDCGDHMCYSSGAQGPLGQQGICVDYVIAECAPGYDAQEVENIGSDPMWLCTP